MDQSMKEIRFTILIIQTLINTQKLYMRYVIFCKITVLTICTQLMVLGQNYHRHLYQHLIVLLWTETFTSHFVTEHSEFLMHIIRRDKMCNFLVRLISRSFLKQLKGTHSMKVLNQVNLIRNTIFAWFWPMEL